MIYVNVAFIFLNEIFYSALKILEFYDFLSLTKKLKRGINNPAIITKYNPIPIETVELSASANGLSSIPDIAELKSTIFQIPIIPAINEAIVATICSIPINFFSLFPNKLVANAMAKNTQVIHPSPSVPLIAPTIGS